MLAKSIRTLGPFACPLDNFKDFIFNRSTIVSRSLWLLVLSLLLANSENREARWKSSKSSRFHFHRKDTLNTWCCCRDLILKWCHVYFAFEVVLALWNWRRFSCFNSLWNLNNFCVTECFIGIFYSYKRRINTQISNWLAAHSWNSVQK